MSLPTHVRLPFSMSSLFRGAQNGPPVVMVTGTPSTDLRLRDNAPTSRPTVGDVKEGDIISVM